MNLTRQQMARIVRECCDTEREQAKADAAKFLPVVSGGQGRRFKFDRFSLYLFLGMLGACAAMAFVKS